MPSSVGFNDPPPPRPPRMTATWILTQCEEFFSRKKILKVELLKDLFSIKIGSFFYQQNSSQLGAFGSEKRAEDTLETFLLHEQHACVHVCVCEHGCACVRVYDGKLVWCVSGGKRERDR